MEENWKKIKEYPNYELSDLGRIKSLSFGKTGKEKILKLVVNRDGYNQVTLTENKKQRSFRVHRLVYLVFNDLDLDSKKSICHKNDIRDDNRLSNLFIGTRKDNSQDMSKKGRAALSKLTVSQVKEIRAISGVKVSAIAKQYGVSRQAIYEVIKRKTWVLV